MEEKKREKEKNSEGRRRGIKDLREWGRLKTHKQASNNNNYKKSICPPPKNLKFVSKC